MEPKGDVYTPPSNVSFPDRRQKGRIGSTFYDEGEIEKSKRDGRISEEVAIALRDRMAKSISY